MRNKFEGVKIDGAELHRGRERQPLSGVTARVETVGQIRQVVSAGRVIMTGGLGLLFRKTVDERQTYLIIDGPAFQWLVEVKPDQQSDARAFAARVTTAARSVA